MSQESLVTPVPSDEDKQKEEIKPKEEPAKPPPAVEKEIVRLSFDVYFEKESAKALTDRNMHRAYDTVDGKKIDLTPDFLKTGSEIEDFQIIYNKLNVHPMMQTPIIQETQVKPTAKPRRPTILIISSNMDDVVYSVGTEPLKLKIQKSDQSLTSVTSDFLKFREPARPYIRVTLRLSTNIPLYEQSSLTVAKQTEEGDLVEQDNKTYDYLTIGKGKIRRRTDAEAQTDFILCKSRATCTVGKKTARKPTYVSYYEMYDTYQEIDRPKFSIYLTPEQTEILTMYIRTKEEQAQIIAKMPSFKESNITMNRLLASNQHEKSLRRYRGMDKPTRFDKEHELNYKIDVLFEFPQPGNVRRASADIDFCPNNGDLCAVAYGYFSHSAVSVPKSGRVCVWSVKNPENPERCYKYAVPCTAVKFSRFLPSLIAIGLYDGNVEVRDITYPDSPPVAISCSGILKNCASIVALRWIKRDESDGNDGIDPFLSLAQDGCVTKFRIVGGPFLLSFLQMQLERIEGKIEGIQIPDPIQVVQHASQNPQGLGLTLHPVYPDIYYILTDEGCVHKCSTSYAHQYIDVIRAHRSSANMLDFSPWSPKVYLTCGNDWSVRVWVEGIYKPLITLKDKLTPLNCAFWSRTHSTIIIVINRKTLDIWDIRRNLLKPMSSTNLESSFHTTLRIAKCGHSIAIGNERGNVIMCQLVDMPFEPHFQYDELEKAIFKAIATHPELINELKNVGYFGYPNKEFVLPP